MTDRIKRAFDEVRASDEVKENTLRFVTRRSRPGFGKRLCGFLLVPAALALFLAGAAAWLYYTPISVISIDVNPSVELGVNRFERIISVEGFGEDGKALAEKLDIRNMNYEKALSEILDEDDIASRLSMSETVVISVVSIEDGEQSALIAENVEANTAGTENIYCHHSSYEQVADAHSQGFSYGKYLAFLEAKEDNPELTADEAKDLSMRELHELCGHGSNNADNGCKNSSVSSSVSSNENTGGGHHHGYGHRRNG